MFPLFSQIATPEPGSQPLMESAPVLGTGTAAMLDSSYLLQFVGSLLLVFLALFAVVYFLRRYNANHIASNGVMRVLTTLVIGQREKIFLIQVGDKQLLIGSTPSSLQTLHVFESPIIASNPQPSTNEQFRTILQNLGAKWKS